MQSLKDLLKHQSSASNSIKLFDLDLSEWQREHTPCPWCADKRIIKYLWDDESETKIALTYCDTDGLLYIGNEKCRARCQRSAMVITWNGRHLAMNCLKCKQWHKFISHASIGITGTRKDKRTINVKAKQRFRILQRDNFTCQACGITSKHEILHVDHKTSIKEATTAGWTEKQINDDNNLWTLCETCNLGKGSQSL